MQGNDHVVYLFERSLHQLAYSRDSELLPLQVTLLTVVRRLTISIWSSTSSETFLLGQSSSQSLCWNPYTLKAITERCSASFCASFCSGRENTPGYERRNQRIRPPYLLNRNCCSPVKRQSPNATDTPYGVHLQRCHCAAIPNDRSSHIGHAGRCLNIRLHKYSACHCTHVQDNLSQHCNSRHCTPEFTATCKFLRNTDNRII